ncbi:MAG: GNAT family N-acetyltransferase [Anaerolineaceae bacterium]|nr:GNAT family N-acetyltransferase [Anaerolineaceae bacterium]
MALIRLMRGGEDEPQILQVNTAFSTDRVYKVKRTGLSYSLELVQINPTLRKDYGQITDLDEYPFVVVAEEHSVICGVAAVHIEAWNKRAVLQHLYVSEGYRSLGIGKLLVQSSMNYAKSSHMRCLWLETQNINYPAIQFYQRMGFEWCGLDTELYDDTTLNNYEIALFFARRIE